MAEQSRYYKVRDWLGRNYGIGPDYYIDWGEMGDYFGQTLVPPDTSFPFITSTAKTSADALRALNTNSHSRWDDYPPIDTPEGGFFIDRVLTDVARKTGGAMSDYTREWLATLGLVDYDFEKNQIKLNPALGPQLPEFVEYLAGGQAGGEGEAGTTVPTGGGGVVARNYDLPTADLDEIYAMLERIRPKDNREEKVREEAEALRERYKAPEKTDQYPGDPNIDATTSILHALGAALTGLGGHEGAIGASDKLRGMTEAIKYGNALDQLEAGFAGPTPVGLSPELAADIDTRTEKQRDRAAEADITGFQALMNAINQAVSDQYSWAATTASPLTEAYMHNLNVPYHQATLGLQAQKNALTGQGLALQQQELANQNGLPLADIISMLNSVSTMSDDVVGEKQKQYMLELLSQAMISGVDSNYPQMMLMMQMADQMFPKE